MDTALGAFIMQAVTGTPIWVWFVAAYLLFVGVYYLQERIVPLARLFIIPVVFVLIKYPFFLSASVYALALYAAGLLSAAGLNMYSASRQSIQVIKPQMLVQLPGSAQTLVLLLLLFCSKYVFGYLYATNQAVSTQLLLWDAAVSGLFSGCFWGRPLYCLQQYLKN